MKNEILEQVEEISRIIYEARKETEYDTSLYPRNALYEFGYEKSIPVLRYIISDKTQPIELRRWSVTALGLLDDQRATALIITIFNDRTEEKFIRQNAAFSLGALKNQLGFEALIQSLTGEFFDDINLKISSIEALKNYESSFEPLTKYLENEEDIKVISAVLKVLEKIDASKTNNFLKQTLLTKENQLSEDVLFLYILNFALNPHTEKSLRHTYLIRLFNEVEETQIKFLILFFYTEDKDWQDINFILNTLNDPDENVVSMAISILEKYDDERVIQPITEKLNHASEKVREAAEKALRTIEGRQKEIE